MLSRSFRLVALVLALALVGAACGGGSSDAELIAAIEKAVEDDAPPGDMAEMLDANCVAKGMVDVLGGADAIEEKYGITADSVAEGDDIDEIVFDEDTAFELTDTTTACADMQGIISATMADQLGGDDEMAECLAKLVPEDAVRNMTAAGFMGDAGAELEASANEALFGAMAQAASECGVGG